MRFKLQVQRGSREFYPGAASSTLGYNGDYLGPTIRVRRGDTVRIDVENRLEETTTLHWHGAHVPAEMDGGPISRSLRGAPGRPSSLSASRRRPSGITRISSRPPPNRSTAGWPGL
jgi:FtsP/CotA-like multicopper oxidase with cupredoxin domain